MNSKNRFGIVLLLIVAILGVAGSAVAGACVNCSAGNFPFPQNKDNPFGTKATNTSSAEIIAAYNKWYTDCVTTSGANGFIRVKRTNDSGLEVNSTVSEGIAYGMIIAVYMNDQPLFDGLWKYARNWHNGNGLMNWYINAAGTGLGSNPSGAGAATDADEDMAWALLMARYQWGGSGSITGTYQNNAITLINNIWNTMIEKPSMVVKNGDGWGGSDSTNVSYYAPAFYRRFGEATNNSAWIQVVDRCYQTMNNSLSQGYGNANNGLVPSWCNSAGVSIWPHASLTPRPWYQYDSCRTPFRTVLDYVWFGDSRAQTYCTKTSNFFSGVGATSIVDGYQLTGAASPELPTLTVSQNPGTQSAAFCGPAGVGGMVSDAYQSFVNASYTNIKGMDKLVGGTYYDECWTVMAMLMMSGNYLDYQQHLPPTPTPTSACGMVTCTPTATATWTDYVQRVNCADTAFTDGLNQTWAADKAFAANSWGYTYAGNEAPHDGFTITGATNNQAQLYRDERYNNPVYVFTVPAGGWYRILFKFAENYFTSAGQRIFNVTAAGIPVITDLDLYAASGGTNVAYDRAVTVQCPTSALTIAWSGVINDGKINAIEVLRVPPLPTPTPTITRTPTWTRTITHTPTITRTFTPTVTATPTATRTFTPTGTWYTSTPTPTSTATLYIVRLNAGGPLTVATGGVTWLADKAYAAGSWGYTGGSAYTSAGPISGTTDAGLYLSERAGYSFDYSFDGLLSGSYIVTLKFAETYHTAGGGRVFRVTAEGVTVVTNLDLFTVAGHDVAYDRTMTVTVSDGQLNLGFAASADMATVMAIQVVQVAPPTATPTRTGSATGTFTRTPTFTWSPTVTSTSTLTRTNTVTMTATASTTPTRSSTSTATRTLSSTPTATNSPTSTMTRTSTPTLSPTGTFTGVPTNTSTATITRSPTPTITNSATRTLTQTVTSTLSPTFTLTSTVTRTSTSTFTNSWTATMTMTSTRTGTPTPTPTGTQSPTFTYTNTSSPTVTRTPTSTLTPTNTFTWTATPTLTRTASSTPSPTLTATRTVTWTSTPTFYLPTSTSTPTASLTWTVTRTHSATFTYTPTSTYTFTSTETRTATDTVTRTFTTTVTSTRTWTGTPSFTSTPTSTWTGTNTFTATRTDTATYTPTATYTATTTYTLTATIPPGTDTPTAAPTDTPTPTFTNTWTFTLTFSPTNTHTFTPTATSTATPTPSATPTATDSMTPTPPFTFTPSRTPTPTSSFTFTFTATVTYTGTSTWTPIFTSTPTFSPTVTRTFTPTWSPTPTVPTATFTNTPSYTHTPTWTVTRTYTGTFTYTPTLTYSVTSTPTFYLLTSTSTPSASWTPSPTNSPTMTSSATSTPTYDLPPSTPTPTASPTPHSSFIIPDSTVVPYPNPVHDEEEVTVNVNVAAASDVVRIQIFTTAFRKISETTLTTLPVGVTPVKVVLLDRKGSPLSNGVYYIRVQSGNSEGLGKLVILR